LGKQVEQNRQSTPHYSYLSHQALSKSRQQTSRRVSLLSYDILFRSLYHSTNSSSITGPVYSKKNDNENKYGVQMFF